MPEIRNYYSHDLAYEGRSRTVCVSTVFRTPRQSVLAHTVEEPHVLAHTVEEPQKFKVVHSHTQTNTQTHTHTYTHTHIYSGCSGSSRRGRPGTFRQRCWAGAGAGQGTTMRSPSCLLALCNMWTNMIRRHIQYVWVNVHSTTPTLTGRTPLGFKV